MILVFLVIFLSTDLFAVRRRGDYFVRPQIGVWFGPTTPLFELRDAVDNSMGAGLFARLNTPFRPLKVGVEGSYQKHESFGTNALTLVPVRGDLLYRLPFDTPLNFQLKAGGGYTFIYVEPDMRSRWDPTVHAGGEVSFPAGKLANVGLRVDYMRLIESHLKGSKLDGNMLNIGLTLYFNL